ncbi:hypothetical protein Desaci_2023 [Desulfosporosinus acidiphilus SJ4]|uniref:Uncharacterized protein n=1 Tax=Desulfosporosinus acidiphilus (strain DSM 22704 / JCM 16185 / SJ4) TaxID=646529 RepID=I4D5C4_DESAJ|nr:hypothetical protein [Desulfosporosinus acidiphilus]AFM40998.1 hypothetical protein Desaci_2023 [Desulfosporosinus acidiphilus SJ4]
MTLDEQLARTNLKYKRYFRWKFKLSTRGRAYKERPLEEIMKIDLIKTRETYYAWEKTEEYQNLVNLLIMSNAGNDLLEIYNVMLDKAKKGDAKAVDTVIKLQKSIASSIKQNSKDNNSAPVEDEEDDLEL